MDKANKVKENKNKNVDIVMQTNIHFAIFIVPIIIAIGSLYYSLIYKESLYFILFILSIIFTAGVYKLSYMNKKFVLTPIKLYFIDNKVKKITINLNKGELIDIAYETTFLGKIFGYSKISFYFLKDNRKIYSSFNFVRNGEELIQKAFIISENYFESVDPNYKRRFKKVDIKTVKQIDDSIDRL